MGIKVLACKRRRSNNFIYAKRHYDAFGGKRTAYWRKVARLYLLIMIRKGCIMSEKKLKVIDKVDVKIEHRNVIVKGPLGELRKSFDDPRFLDIEMKVEDGNFAVLCHDD